MRRLLPGSRSVTSCAAAFAAGAGRVVLLASFAVFTAVVVALLIPAFTIERVSVAARVAVVLLAAASAIRPGGGLIAMGTLVAVAEVLGPLVDSRVRNAELLVLAGLAGALLRAWWSGAIREVPSNALETAAIAFGLVIAASLLEQLWFLQLQRDFPGPFLHGLWAWMQSDYLVGPSIYGSVVGAALLLLESLALLVWASRSCAADPRLAGRMAAALAIGGVAAAAFTWFHVVTEFMEAGLLVRQFPGFVWNARWAIHVRDVNGAGAYFALALLLAAGRGVAAKHRRARAIWGAGALLVFTTLLLTRSRTALIVLALGAAGAVAVRAARGPVPRWARIGGALAAALVAIWLAADGIGRGSSGVGVQVRREFLATTGRMIAWQPLSGVGIGQFSLWSQHFSSPELRDLYRVENAHNNFAQVAGELGLPGLAALLGVLLAAFGRWRRGAATSRGGVVTALGVLVFVASWLGNHPLLLHAIAFPFWIALGAAPAATGAPPPLARAGDPRRSPSRALVLLLACAAALAASLPLRVEGKSDAIDWARISYGFHSWEGEGAGRFRWMSGRARLYLAGDVARFRLPVRALVSEEAPLTLTVLVDGRPATRVEMSNWDVHVIDLTLRGIPDRSAWQIDLVASRSWVPAETSADSQDTRELSAMVWPMELFDRRNRFIRVEPEAPAVQAPPRRRRTPNRSAARPLQGWRRGEGGLRVARVELEPDGHAA